MSRQPTAARTLCVTMSDITISLPDGSQRTLPAGATATTVAEGIGSRLAKAARRRAGRRRGVGSRPRAARRGRGGDHHGRLRGRPPRAAPLDVARARPGRDAAVPRRQVLHRPGDRGRLLLRLRPARRAHVQRRRPRRDRGADARDHQGRPAVRAQRGARRRGAGAVRRPAVQARDHRAGRPGAPTTRSTPARSAAARRSACTATRRSSSTCAAARTCRPRRGSATSS